MTVSVVAHCDWSRDGRKRWLATAVRQAGGWVTQAPELVGDTATLVERLRRRAVAPGALLIGFDFPIGLPEAYARAADLVSFRAALDLFGSGAWSAWYDVARSRDEIALHRPFYPARSGGKGEMARAHLFDALGLGGEALLRRCERKTADRQAAAMLFWTLGSNQVGKAAITGWREIIVPRRHTIGLWPFDGDLADLTARHAVVVAETYPGDVYPTLGLPRGWSKRNRDGRQRVGRHILDWLDARRAIDAAALRPLIRDGFGDKDRDEDPFDATIGLLGMLEVVDGRRAEGAPTDEAVRTWEGWILGHHRPAARA